MAFLGVTVCFTMRMCFSIALTEMVKVKPIENKEVGNDTVFCPAITLSIGNITVDSDIAHNKGTQYNWTQEEQGFCFYESEKSSIFPL